MVPVERRGNAKMMMSGQRRPKTKNNPAGPADTHQPDRYLRCLTVTQPLGLTINTLGLTLTDWGIVLPHQHTHAYIYFITMSRDS